MKKALLILPLIALIGACRNDNKSDDTESANAVKPPAAMGYTVVKTYPHDTTSFTEGLLLHDGLLYESTGLEGESRLLKADLATGKAVKSIKLSNEDFGEGISIINNKIYQLTYTEHKAYVYDMDFKKIGEFSWPYEGWGMTTDGKYLILDTGGSNIYYVNPETFKIERTLSVFDNNGYVNNINELEYVDGALYANIWQTDYIIRINTQTGIVEARADMSDIWKKSNVTPGVTKDVLNGIAYDAAKKSFYVTGKRWPAIFEVKFN